MGKVIKMKMKSSPRVHQVRTRDTQFTTLNLFSNSFRASLVWIMKPSYFL